MNIEIPKIQDYLKQNNNNIVIDNLYFLKYQRIGIDCPLISIITVVRNSEKTIERTILSVLNQGYENLEYIIIDGGSTDGTIEIINNYKQSISICISEPDKGISDAFNKGISVSNGKIIGLINSDDWYEDNAVNQVMEQFHNAEIDIVHGNLIRWKTNGEAEVSESNDTLLKIDSTVNHPTVFVKRELYENIGLFRNDFVYAMDYEWLLRAKIQNTTKFKYVNSNLANMCLSGVSSRQWKKANAEVLRAKNLHYWNINNYLYFYYKIAKGLIEKKLTENGFDWIVTKYRKSFSMVKKQNISM